MHFFVNFLRECAKIMCVLEKLQCKLQNFQGEDAPGPPSVLAPLVLYHISDGASELLQLSLPLLP